MSANSISVNRGAVPIRVEVIMKCILLLTCLAASCAPAQAPTGRHIEESWHVEVWSGGSVIKNIETATWPDAGDSGRWYFTGADGKEYILSGTIVAYKRIR